MEILFFLVVGSFVVFLLCVEGLGRDLWILVDYSYGLCRLAFFGVVVF